MAVMILVAAVGCNEQARNVGLPDDSTSPLASYPPATAQRHAVYEALPSQYPRPRASSTAIPISPSPTASATATDGPPTQTPFPQAAHASAINVAAGFIVDGNHGRIFVRDATGVTGYARNHVLDAPLYVLDQRTLEVVAQREAIGILGLDADRRRVLLDDASSGLRVLDADTLTNIEYIELPPVPDLAAEASFFPDSTAPIVDPSNGKVFVARDARLYVVDIDAAEPAHSLVSDESSRAAWIEDMMVDGEARRLYLVRRVIGESCYILDKTIETYDLDTLELLHSRTDCELSLLGAWYGKVLVDQQTSKYGPMRAMLLERDRTLVQVTAGPRPGSVRDERRRRLYGSTAPLIWFDDETLDPLGMSHVSANGTLVAYDPVTDSLYFLDDGAIVVHPADELAAPGPLPDLPAVELVTRPTRLSAVSRGMASPAEFDLVGVATGLSPPGSSGCRHSQDGGRWGWVYGRPGQQPWHMLNAWLPCSIVSTSMRLVPSPTFSSSGDAILASPAYSAGGTYRTDDGGRSWLLAMRGLQDRGVLDVVYSPSYEYDRTVYMTTTGGRSWRSADGGSSWHSLGRFTGLTVAGTTPDGVRLFASASHFRDIFTSDDSGTTWRWQGHLPGTGYDPHPEDSRYPGHQIRYLNVLDADPANVTLLAVTCSEQWLQAKWPTHRCQLHRSADSGVTWSAVTPEFGGPPIDEYVPVVGPLGDGATWLLQFNRGNRGTTPSFLRSDDHGVTWYAADLPSRIHGAPVVAGPDDALLAAIEGSLFEGVDLDEMVVLSEIPEP